MKEMTLYVVQQCSHNSQEYDRILGIFGSKEAAETCKKMFNDTSVIKTIYAEKTIKEIFDTLTEEQKQAVYVIVGAAVEEAQSLAELTRTLPLPRYGF